MILTKIQEQTLKFMKEFKKKKKVYPTSAQVGKRFKITTPSGWGRIHWLKKNKLIK